METEILICKDLVSKPIFITQHVYFPRQYHKKTKLIQASAQQQEEKQSGSLVRYPTTEIVIYSILNSAVDTLLSISRN